jgi:hypothetical protein
MTACTLTLKYQYCCQCKPKNAFASIVIEHTRKNTKIHRHACTFESAYDQEIYCQKEAELLASYGIACKQHVRGTNRMISFCT